MTTQPSERRRQYLEKFKDPRWQKMRLKILERDEWACQLCFDSESTLNVHHRYYTKGSDPWEYPPEALVTLCESCHSGESESRYAEEQFLLRSLRKHFFSGDINCLARAFDSMEPQHVPEVVSSALEWVLTDKEVQREVVERYLVDLSERLKKKRNVE